MPISVPPYPQLNYGLQAQFDPSTLTGLGDALLEGQDRRKKNRIDSATQSAFQGGIPMRPDGSPDYAAMASRLFEAGNVDTGMGLTRLAETQAQNAWQQQRPIEVGGALINPQTYEPEYVPEPEPEKPAAGYIRTPQGTTFDPGGPADPAVIEAQNRARAAGRPRTATDMKAIQEADDMVFGGENVIQMLDKALELNNQALSGPGAATRGYVGSIAGDYLPDGAGLGSGIADKDAGVATEDLRNIVTGGALESLKTIFGGMPTEGERKVLLEIQGSVNKAPEVRERIYKRAKALAARRIEFNRTRAQELRSSNYYDEQGGQSDVVAGPPEAGQMPPGWTPEEWGALTPEEKASIQ